MDLVTVASLLGHTRLDTTAIYTQPTKADQEHAVERIAERVERDGFTKEQ